MRGVQVIRPDQPDGVMQGERGVGCVGCDGAAEGQESVYLAAATRVAVAFTGVSVPMTWR